MKADPKKPWAKVTCPKCGSAPGYSCRNKVTFLLSAHPARVKQAKIVAALPLDWAAFKWPDWVPADIRRGIQSFWSAAHGRNPQQWHAGTVGDPYNKHLDLGTRVRAKGFLPGDPEEIGRWVPCWNNIGRIVRDDGTYTISSTGCVIEKL